MSTDGAGTNGTGTNGTSTNGTSTNTTTTEGNAAQSTATGARTGAASTGAQSSAGTGTSSAQARDTIEDLTQWMARVMSPFSGELPAAAGAAASAAASSSTAQGAPTNPAAMPPRTASAQRTLEMLLADTEAGAPAAQRPPMIGPSAQGSGAPQSASQMAGASSEENGCGNDGDAVGNGSTGESSSSPSAGLAGSSLPASSTSPAVPAGPTGTASSLAQVAAATAAWSGAGSALADPTHAATSAAPPAATSAVGSLALQSALHAEVGSTAWADELGGQLTWMAQHGIGSASLHVSPPDLGPIEVRVSVHGMEASVWFGAAQADTRAALEQALPRLHELFGAQGLALADAGVFREAPRQQHEQPATPAGAAGAAQGTAEPSAQGSIARPALGLLDLYA